MISPTNEKILNILRQNAKLSTREISQQVKIPITTVHNRIKKMEGEGVIKGYTAIVDHKKLGKNIQAIIDISVNYMGPAGRTISQQKLAEQLYQMTQVENCYITTGKSDISIQVIAKDVEELNDFVINKLRNIPGVENTTTSIVLMDLSEKKKKPSPVV
ncbi:MAG: hypothetical protein A2787_00165 [Omnitrophica WOR_2 bacterium RIFCSPHIGHO2_01_FULL_48_9]|nr:MAG: hypothetical protein A2787_00165 [Omnitrophica WOR_2 bacterium RIFCSPHIGHO2_01_FULL_48_9]